MKATEHLSTSRTMSLIALTLLVLVIDVTNGHLERMRPLTSARELVAEAVVRDWLTRTQQKLDGSGLSVGMSEADHPFPELGTTSVKVESFSRSTLGESLHPDETNAPSLSDWKFRVSCTTLGGRVWETEFKPTPTHEGLQSELCNLLARAKISCTAEEPAGRLFTKLEEALDRKVELALIGVSVRPGLAVWLLAGAFFVLLVKIRRRVRDVFDDPERARDEPWLLLDAKTSLERSIGGLWLAGLALGSTPMLACLAIVTTSLLRAAGARTSLLQDAALVLATGALGITTFWLGLTLASDLLRLRRERAAQRS